jgi:hypothetical protein
MPTKQQASFHDSCLDRTVGVRFNFNFDTNQHWRVEIGDIKNSDPSGGQFMNEKFSGGGKMVATGGLEPPTPAL